MKVTQPPSQFIDESDGNQIFEVSPLGSRYEVIAVKQLNNGIEVRAIEHGTEREVEFRATPTNQSFDGVTVDSKEQRNIDDDIQNVLHMLGYAVVDENFKSY